MIKKMFIMVALFLTIFSIVNAQDEQPQCFQPLDMMMVIDRSTSMEIVEGGTTRIEAIKSEALLFLNMLNFSKDTIGLVSFATTATLDQGLTSSKPQITSAVNNLQVLTPPPQRTNIGEGIRKGQLEISNNARNNSLHILFVLSDGASNEWGDPPTSCTSLPTIPTDCSIYAFDQAQLAKDAGTIIFTIGIGVNNFTQNRLTLIASDPSKAFFTANASAVLEVLENISEVLCPCGNGILEPNLGEQCDDGNIIDGDGCSNMCQIEYCGDGILQESLGEECDDGNNISNDGCSSECENETPEIRIIKLAGDASDGTILNVREGSNVEYSYNVTNIGEVTLTNANVNDDKIGFIGNIPALIIGQSIVLKKNTTININTTNIGEVVADSSVGSVDDSDDAIVEITLCGDGIVQSIYGEECDDGNNENDDGCNEFCMFEICGDDVIQPSLNEECELPNTSDNQFCGQSTQQCSGNLTGLRDAYGDCDDACGCIYDPFEYVCVLGSCGAACDSDDDCDDSNEITVDTCNLKTCGCLHREINLILKDAKVGQAMYSSNFGIGRYMIVNPKQGGTDRAYIRIDVSGMLGQNLTKSNLSAVVFYTGPDVIGSQIEAYYCPDHDFEEFTITWYNQPFDGMCVLADTYNITQKVIAGNPLIRHSFDLLDETNSELNGGDGLFTIVLKSSEENTGVINNGKYVQYLTKEYPEEAYRPILDII